MTANAASGISAWGLAEEIKRIYADAPHEAQGRIEAYLDRRLALVPVAEKIDLLRSVIDLFDADDTATVGAARSEQNVVAKLLPLIMGGKASQIDFSSEEQIEVLSRNLNTVFDTLNRLIRVINATLKGGASQQETIRSFIGGSLENGSDAVSLSDYLSQIEQAFLKSQRAFREAAAALVEEILDELDPQRIEDEERHNRFGLFRKAELLDLLREKHRRCRLWLESDRFEQRLLRKFENCCSRTFDS